MLGGLAVAVLVIVAMVLLGEYTKTRGRLFLTALVLAGFCLSALPPSILHVQRRYRPTGETGILASVVGFVLVATGIWVTPDPDAYWKAAAIASVLAVSMFHSSWLLLLEPRRSFLRITVRSPIAATPLAALMSVLGIILELKPASYWWAVFLILILALAGSLASLVLSRWGGSGTAAGPEDSRQ